MASLMVFPAVILSTATTRQSTSAMAGCLYQRLLFMLMLVMVTTGGTGQDTGSSSVVRILAVFDQSEMETMERVMHKTLIALNKEKTAWTGSSDGNGGGRWNRLLNSGIGVNNVTSSINKKSRNKWFGVQRWPCCPFDGGQCHVLFSVVVQSDGRRSRPSHKLTHRPVAVLVLSADDRSVFRVALVAAPFQLPVIGARLPNEDSTIHLSG